MNPPPNTKSKVIIDGNIFGLQVRGGVSGYAARIFVEMSHRGLTPEIIRPHSLKYQGFGASLVSNAERVISERIPAKLAQYLPASVSGDAIFLSPYYRRPLRKVKKYVVTVHDFTYERFRRGAALHVHHYLKSSAINAADEIICISEATRLDLLDYCPRVDPTRIHVIPHGVDMKVFFPDVDSEISKKLYRSILFVGQRSGYKRFELAVKSVAQVRDLSLAIVGPILTKEEVELLLKFIPNRWQYFGRVNDDELRRIYSSAHGFIFPSDYEGFGLPVLEAMACGCPVITSADRALREVSSGAGLHSEEQDPESYANVLSLLDDASVRSDLRRNGLLLASNSSWDECIRRTINVIVSQ